MVFIWIFCLFHSFLPVNNALSSQTLRPGLSWTHRKALPCGWSPTKARRDRRKPTRCLGSQRLLQNGTENVHKGRTPTSQQYISKLFYAERSPNLRRQECNHVFLILCSYLKLPLLKRKLTCFSSTSQECRNVSRGEKLSLKWRIT